MLITRAARAGGCKLAWLSLSLPRARLYLEIFVPSAFRSASAVSAAVAAIALVGASPVQAQPAAAVRSTATPLPGGASDPFERVNRGLYAVHRGIDKVLLRPVALGYAVVTPRPVRAGIRNALVNLGQPVTFVNQVLQARFTHAGESVVRFAANSTVGVAGLFDVAGKNGLPNRPADFGQTLGRYGVTAGPYIFIPVLGPSTLRDGLGRVADSMADPVKMVQFEGDSELNIGRIAFAAVDARLTFDQDLQALDQTATDPYITLRSVYLQNRETFINGGAVDVDALPSFGPDPTTRPRSQGSDVTEPPTQVSETAVRSVR